MFGELQRQRLGTEPLLPRIAERKGLKPSVFIDDDYASAGAHHAAEFVDGAGRHQRVLEGFDAEHGIKGFIVGRKPE